VERPVGGPEDAARQDDLRIEPREASTTDRREGEQHGLVGEPVDDPAGHGVAGGRCVEYDRRELIELLVGDPPFIDRSRQREWSRQPVMGRDETLQRGPRPPTIAGSYGRRQGSNAGLVTSSPVARGVIARGVDQAPTVWRDRADVDPAAHHHDHAPAACRTGAEPGEDVVLERDRSREAETLEAAAQQAEVGRKVGAGETEHGPFGDGTRGAVDAGLRRCDREELLQPGESGSQTDLLVRDGRPSNGPEDRAVVPDEDDVGLRVPAVDSQDGDAVRSGACGRRGYRSTPVITTPRTKKRWKMRKSTTGMTIVMSVPAWISPGCSAMRAPLNEASPTGRVTMSGFVER